MALSGEFAYVVNQDSNSISVIDIENNNLASAPITKGLNAPSAIAVTPDAKFAYIANAGNNSISIIDIENGNRVGQQITKGIFCPYAIAITPNGRYAYVANLGNNNVMVIDIEKDHEVHQIITEGIARPYAIAITPNGKYAYVANLGSNTVSVIEIENGNQVIQNITKEIHNPYGIAITPNGKYAYVVNGGNHSVAVIEIENGNQVSQSITKNITAPHGIAITPNGKYAYVTNSNDSVCVIEIESGHRAGQLITAEMSSPYSIVITPDGKYAYVANLGNGTVAVIDIENGNRVIPNTIKGVDSPHAIAIIPVTNKLSFQSNTSSKSPPQNLLRKNLLACHLYDERSLFDDREEMVAYLAAFPIADYSLHFSKDTGYFYIDSIDEPIKNRIRQGGTWEAHVHDQVKKYALAGTTVLDIGAHIGTETVLMANCVGAYGKVHAFEPQKKIFRELLANCLVNKIDERVTLYRMAIGNAHNKVETGKVEVSWDEAGIGLWGGGDLAEMRTIDSFNFQNVSFVKIDVEGGEDAVIAGMVETLKRNKPVIVIEIQGGWPWEKAPPDINNKILATQKKLSDLGYEVHHLTSWDYIALPK